MSACILRGPTVTSLLNAMNHAIRAIELAPAVVAVTTDVLGGELRTMRDILIHTPVADLGIELPITDLVGDPAHAELESHQ